MSLNMSEIFNSQSLENALVAQRNFEGRLREHLEMNYEETKKELTEAVSHWSAEVERLKALVNPKIVAHMLEGKPAQVAIQHVDAGIPTRAEIQAAHDEANMPKIIQ